MDARSSRQPCGRTYAEPGPNPTVPAASRGYDGGRKVPGRKRHIVTDILGLLLVVAVTAANIGDRDAAAGLLRRLRRGE
ncbi:transposase [Streptomyces cacaoi]|uniref:transposase n=1 Tax=Streptomyces cacaoi TaxID=1898 RepID=UPI003749E452